MGSACGSSGSDSDSGNSSGFEGAIESELLPFSAVQENDFVFEGDPSDPGRGIFRVRTTEPMICAIVWGETEDFGNFNNSLAMNGTGIIDHDVVLPGAEAGEIYFFRVQGSTADGSQYRSETGTFTIPEVEGGGEATEMVVHSANLALNATVVEVSSIFGPGWEGQNAIDDDTNTEWATSGDGDGGFIVLDLGSPQEVAGVEFLTRSMLDGSATTEMYSVTAGDETFGPFPAGNPANPRFTEIEFTGQVVRFDIETSSGGNVGATEVKVFAPAGS
jgi:hypothetical protein